MSVVYIRNGVVTDKADFVFNSEAITDNEALTSFITEHYMYSDSVPKNIILSFELDEEDANTLESFLSERSGHRVYIKKPERGVFKELIGVVYNNATEKARQTKIETQKDQSVLVNLAQMLKLEVVPERIEAYDISNIGRENITAGMVVYKNGKPQKSDYRLFKIKTVTNMIDDYASMREALKRRIDHLKEDKSGSFSEYPDLLLIDGGKGHVSVVKEVLRAEGIDIPVFGMVKDDFHKTRALCTDTEEINIARERAIFMLIYGIQEEVHRFTVGRVNSAKRSSMKHSSLEKIDGIGPSKAKKILLEFGTMSALKKASAEEISAVKGITQKDAEKIYKYFNKK